MSGGIIGGDEVGAIVVDMGSHTTRVGYAGEDMPKADFPSYVGVIEEFVDKTDSMDISTATPSITDSTSGKPPSSSSKRYLIDTMSVKAPKPRMQVQPMLKDTLVEDWDLFENVLQYTFGKHLRCDPAKHPILMSEPVTNTKQKREKLCEIMFEKFQTPGFFLCKNGVLSSFASNRTSGLVLDCGAAHTTAIPIHDGYVLHKAVAQTPLGGDFVVTKCRQLLEEQLNIEIVPYYVVKSKEAVKPGEPARFTRRTDLNDITDSYKRFMIKDTLQDFATQVLQVSDTAYNESEISVLPRIVYEFPNGFNTDFGEERFRIPEALFNPAVLKGVQANIMLDMVHLITSSINMCDAELRSSFYSNIMVVGGNSLLTGFVERLNYEFNHLNYKTKISAPTTVAERRFSTWIGGSILGSLGTFHQMWISKQEYEETGKFIIDKKCV